MCWKPLYTRLKTKKDKTKNTTLYVLDTTIHKTQDEERQNKNTTLYVLDTTIHKIQDEERQNKNTTLNTICVGHHYTQDSRRRKTKQITQRYMCWTPLCANKHKNGFNSHVYFFVLLYRSLLYRN